MDADALDVAVIKPMFVGGVSSAQQMVQAAEARGVRVMITCALESRIGRIATAHLAVSTKTPIIAYGAGHHFAETRMNRTPPPVQCSIVPPNQV